MPIMKGTFFWNMPTPLILCPHWPYSAGRCSPPWQPSSCPCPCPGSGLCIAPPTRPACCGPSLQWPCCAGPALSPPSLWAAPRGSCSNGERDTGEHGSSVPRPMAYAGTDVPARLALIGWHIPCRAWQHTTCIAFNVTTHITCLPFLSPHLTGRGACWTHTGPACCTWWWRARPHSSWHSGAVRSGCTVPGGVCQAP